MTVYEHGEHSHTMHECIQLCESTFHNCMETMREAVGRGTQPDQELVSLLLSCAEAAQAAVRFLVILSPYHERLVALCQEICLRCAWKCESFSGDDLLKRCAEHCRACATACQKQLDSMAYHYRAA